MINYMVQIKNWLKNDTHTHQKINYMIHMHDLSGHRYSNTTAIE